MQLYDKNTKEVRESPEGPQIGAFFDFDGTVIYGYSAVTYLREQLRRGDVRPRQLGELVRTMTKFSMGSIGFSAMMTETSKYLKGIDEKEYIEFGESLYKKHIAKLIYPESRALIEEHLKKGHTVALVSAATPYQVTSAARELGIKHVKCTSLEVVDGKFTGDVVKPTCYGMGKVAAAEELGQKFDIDMQQSFFYSDSDEDIQLLEHVGKPRPLNPNTRLRNIARGRGWPVQDFNSRGKVGLTDYLKTFATQGSMVGSFMAGLPILALTGSKRKARNFSMSLFADTATALTGIEMEVEGEEYVWTDRPCVFVFNHQSQADTIIVPALLRRDLAGVGKKEIANVPILGRVMQYAGTVLIDRENSASARESMEPLIDVMRNEGRCVCIAPEGTRSTSTNLGRFKKGAFHLALQAQVPIVPIVIHNAIDVAPRGQYVMRPATVKVKVLPPVDTSDWTVENMNQQVDQVRDMFLVELDQMHLQRPAEAAPEAKLTKSAKAKTVVTKAVKARAVKAKAVKAKAVKRKTVQSKAGQANKAVVKAADKITAKKTAVKKSVAKKKVVGKKVVSKVLKKVAAKKSSAVDAVKKVSKKSVTKAKSKTKPKTAAKASTRLSRRRVKKVAVPKVSARLANQQADSVASSATPAKAKKLAPKRNSVKASSTASSKNKLGTKRSAARKTSKKQSARVQT